MGSRHRADSLVIEALADGLTDAKTAEKAGVSVKTVRRRRQDPEIAAQVRQLIAERRRERDRRAAEIWDAGESLDGAAMLELRTLADLFEGGVGDATLIAVTRERLLGVRVPVDLPPAPEPEPELARVIALPPADGLTDLERDLLMKKGLYREGVPAAINREVLKRAGYG